MMILYKVIAFFLTLSIGGIIFSQSAFAVSIHYNKNKLMTNRALTTVAMPPRAIQAFLEDRDSVLATHTVRYRGKRILASTYIYKMGKRFQINPELVLTLAAKESSATEISRWTDAARLWTLGYAVCDSCSLEDAAEFRGFKNQIHYGTQQFRLYLEDMEENNRTIAGWGVGVPKRTFDDIRIVPRNAATAAHYSYTPWVGVYDGGARCCGGNSLFQKLWQIYGFNTSGRIRIPKGVLVRVDGRDAIYTIDKTYVREVYPEVIAADYIDVPVATVSENIFEDQYLRFYREGRPIRFPNGTVVRNSNTGKTFLIVNNRKYEFGERALAEYEYDEESVVLATTSELQMKSGPMITHDTPYPAGALLRNRVTNGVYYYDPFDQKLHFVPNETVLHQNFVPPRPNDVAPSVLAEFSLGDDVLLRNGTLIQSNKPRQHSGVYVIEDGVLYRFTSNRVFNRYGLHRRDILTVPDTVFGLYTVSQEVIDAKKKAGVTY